MTGSIVVTEALVNMMRSFRSFRRRRVGVCSWDADEDRSGSVEMPGGSAGARAPGGRPFYLIEIETAMSVQTMTTS